MIIKADKEAQKELAELADVVLKAVGLQAYNKVGKVLNSIQLINETPEVRLPSGELQEDQ
ncbi:MAG: hypothetical protein M0R17_04485 [Candidatus Omnitrophica bacterium]|jgi:hypothetical protein|nr:hypothetical protein [Candidatus Omnitrophota bacterium]